jgi:hypothetical protein
VHLKSQLPNQILINRDRLLTIFGDYKNGVQSGSDWRTPIGILISVILCVFATEDFNSVSILTKDQVALLVYLIGLGAFFFFVRSVVRSFSLKAEDELEKDIMESILNVPDYTVIYIIKLTKDNIPRILVEKKATWDCYFLPYAARKSSGLMSTHNITEFQRTIASYLGLQADAVSIEHLRECALISEKFSPKDQVYKQYNFDFFFFNIQKENMLENYEQPEFRVGGKSFYWMTLDDLTADAKTMDRNGDVINHLQDNYTEIFSKTGDSFN